MKNYSQKLEIINENYTSVLVQSSRIAWKITLVYIHVVL